MNIMIGTLGLILAIVIMIIGAYRGMGALPLTLLAGLVAAIANAPAISTIFQTTYIWDTFATTYMKGYTGTITSYLLMLCFSSLYAKLMQKAGCSQAIAYKLIDWFGKKKVILVSVLVISILTYGGVSLFVVVYAVAPIMFTLFAEKNIPRHLAMGCLMMGAASYTMTCLPGTPQLTNLVPTEFLGTTLTAAPVLGILCAIGVFTIGYTYMMYAERKAIAAGETFEYPAGYDMGNFDGQDRSKLPNAVCAFTPCVLLITFIIVFSRLPGFNSTMIATFGMMIGAASVLALNWKQFKDTNWIEMFTDGLEGGIAGIGGLAAVVAFGVIVKETPAFAKLVEAVLAVEMHPYVRGVLGTVVFSAITGSSSGGLRITLQALQESLLNSGVNMETLHRLMVVSADALDTMPHSSGLFLMFSVLGLTHKQAYKHIFFTSTIAPMSVVIVATIICILFGF